MTNDSKRASRTRATSCKPLTLEDHVRLAPDLYAARQAVTAALPAFPKSGSPTRKILRFLGAIDELRAELERQVCRIVPASRDPRRLAIRIYHGARLIPRSEDVRDETDSFAAWDEVKNDH